jgi:hypothetical protein
MFPDPEKYPWQDPKYYQPDPDPWWLEDDPEFANVVNQARLGRGEEPLDLGQRTIGSTLYFDLETLQPTTSPTDYPIYYNPETNMSTLRPTDMAAVEGMSIQFDPEFQAAIDQEFALREEESALKMKEAEAMDVIS